MTTIAIRIVVLSTAMAVFIGVGFRGIEYDPLEAGPSLLGYFVAFTIWTLIAAPLYKMKAGPDDKAWAAFTFRFWAITAALVSIGMIIYSTMDVASDGAFRGNVIVGGIVMAVMVVILNYALVFGLRRLESKRRRAAR